MHPALKDDQERLKVYNTPFETLKGHVYCHLSGGVSRHKKRWAFQFRQNKKNKRISFGTRLEAKNAWESWVSEKPFERCGTVYVRYGDDLLCRSKNGTKWWMSLEDKNLLDGITWGMTRFGYVRGSSSRKNHHMHCLIMKRVCAPTTKKYQVDHINQIRHDNRRANLRWASGRDNGRNKTMKRGPSGRLGILHNAHHNSFLARFGSVGKNFVYELGNFKDAQRAWEKALDARIEYEKKHMHPNHTDYLKRTPLDRAWWDTLQEDLKISIPAYNSRRRDRRAQKRKGSPVDLGDKGVKK